MSLAAGTRIGPYEVVSMVGAGGMGEVYRAHDTSLKRDVALKILPESFAADAERLARFHREAEVLASLNHPNIAGIHGLAETGGLKALVMELVEGDDLADQIRRGPIPVDEALPIARQIAEALEAAHDQGIAHRDLKPANIKLRGDGTVKVLDFGLAKVLKPAASIEGAVATSATMTSPMMTQRGVILGTAAYMSPEQAKGHAVDERADAWAFGCVLYEMLTGRRAFEGETVAEVLAAILQTDPDWRRLPSTTPEPVRRLLRRTLHKDPRFRLRDIHDARVELADVQGGAPGDGAAAHVAPASRAPLRWAVGLALVALTAVLTAAWEWSPAGVQAPEVRFEINPTSSPWSSSLAVSPDGRSIVFEARAGAQSQLWLRSLESVAARPLPGTAGGWHPFWSPDSRSVAFFAGTSLKLLNIAAGSVTTLRSEIPSASGGAWGQDGTILFSPHPGSPLMRMSANGGEPVAATSFEPRQHQGHFAPQILPDGRHFLFFVNGRPEARGVYVGTLDAKDVKRLLDGDASAVYANRHLLFVRDGKLMAQRFDADQLKMIGDPVLVADDVPAGTVLSASPSGTIVYRAPAAETGQRQFVWVDRTGVETERVMYRDASALGPALSPDGRRVAVFRRQGENMDIWTYDRVRRIWERVTTHPGDDIYPLWSPDGSRIIFGSRRGGMDLYSKLLDAPVERGEDLLLNTPEVKFPTDWSRDGQFVLYNSIGAGTGVDIWVLPLEGNRRPREIVRTEFNEQHPQFSPDGRWIAYQSDKTGRFEIYLRAFNAEAGDTPVSVEGGSQARWSPDGTELFYVAPDDWLMAVSVQSNVAGDVVETGKPVSLFLTTVGSTAPNTNRQQYSVAPDGRSFLMNSVPAGTNSSPITVILNWRPGLQ